MPRRSASDFVHRAGAPVRSVALLAALLALAGRVSPAAPAAAAAAATPGQIGHVIVVMMENRSFDHLVGWAPGADGRQAGLTYQDSTGASHPTHHLAPDYQGCGFADPGHSYEVGRIEWNGGGSDGWLFAGTNNDAYSIGYYREEDVPFFAGLVANWTLCDRYFSPLMSSTFPNKLYMFSADTDRLASTVTPIPSALPTIFDRLDVAGVTNRYYFGDIPFVALWGTRYLSKTRHTSDFFADAAAGTLPEVAIVEPRFSSGSDGTSCDDHPFGDIRCGQKFLADVYEAVIGSPNWQDVVLVITYDEWGGFFDHVDPDAFGRPPVPPAQALLDLDQPGLRGFRVPTFVISPWAPRGSVDHGVYDHASILRMIEWNWDITPLTVRDEIANNLADVLDFDQPNLEAPHFAVSAGPFAGACPEPSASESNDFEELYAAAEGLGFLNVERCWAGAGLNGFTTLPLHAGLPPPFNPCDIGDPCGDGSLGTNIEPAVVESIYLLVRNHDAVAGVQTAFNWNRSWVLLSSDWTCQPGQVVIAEPTGPGPDAGTLTTTFDCITGPATAVIGRMRMIGGAGCVTQVESSRPFGTHVVSCAGDVTPVHSGCRGRVCVQVGGVNACYPGIVSAVEVTRFEALGVVGGVRLVWSLHGSTDVQGFNIFSASAARGPYEQRNNQMLAADRRDYFEATEETRFFKLEVIERDGSTYQHGPIIGLPSPPPASHPAVQNAPNPFRESTLFRFTAAPEERVTIDIYDVTGTFIARVHEGTGSGTAKWNGRDANGQAVSSGVYVYKMKIGENHHTSKLVVYGGD